MHNEEVNNFDETPVENSELNSDLYGNPSYNEEQFGEYNREINEGSGENFEVSSELYTNDLNNQDPIIVHNEEVNNFDETPVENSESYSNEEEIVFRQGLEENFELPIVKSKIKNNLEEVQNNSTNIMSDTPIEELNKLTEFEKEEISSTDIKSLFARVGVNVKEASDIFMKNTEMKEKIDNRFEELKKLQSEVEKTKKSQYDEINAYKQEVFDKLTEKKEEIETRINKLRDFQANLEKEKEEFEKFRKTEKEEIERVQKEIQDAYDSRRDELSHIEDVLRRQKDSLDEERSQLSLDRIQYEADKNELANNLLKFNEIVDSFTNGMDKAGKE